jgi:hypothetical protein
MTRRFPAPWTVEQIPSGFKVVGANGQSLVYVYARETKAEADIAKVLTFDEARRHCQSKFVYFAKTSQPDFAAIDFPAFFRVDLSGSMAALSI